MKAHTLTYRGKEYEFPIHNGELQISDNLVDFPKSVLLILHFGISSGAYTLSVETADAVYREIGKFLGDGGLNDKGKRVFAKEPEVLAAVMPHRSLPTQAITLPDTTVASSEPKLATLLFMIHQFLLRFMVFPDPAQAPVIALWIAHTWVIDAFHFTPYLFIYSPTKRSGKSRLLECLAAVVCRPWSVVSATEATIMRKINADRPTILFDEIDTIYGSNHDKSKEGLRAVLNCGFMRGSTVPRCAGQGVVEYSVFSAKAFAGIGDSLPNTVKDRSIRIHLVRRAKDQAIETFRIYDVETSTNAIVEGLTSWAGNEDTTEQLQASRPVVSHELGDRAADIAEPLLAIAELAGEEWANAGRASLVALLQANEEEADEPGVRLLFAIRDIFAQERKRQMPTIHILRKLASREEEEAWTMQWPREFASGNTRGPAAKMASLLRPYGISAGSIRLPDGTTPKGYRVEAFSDAFSRYLPNLFEKVATTPQDAVEHPLTNPADTERTDHGKP